MSPDETQPLSEEAEAPPGQEPSVGERLREARNAQPLSLAQISAELRIDPSFLTALEEDRLEDFPAPVFAKIDVPVLSIIGSLDVQVSAEQNNAGLR